MLNHNILTGNNIDVAGQLRQWNPFLTWIPNRKVVFLPKLHNEPLSGHALVKPGSEYRDLWGQSAEH